MTDYTITTNFGAKDDLPSGNAAKVIKGEEFTTEFTNIQTAVNTKADTAGDTFTGVVNFSADVAVNTNTLFVDVSEAKVGIGTTSPDALLTLDKDVSTAYDSSSDDAQRSNTNTLLLKNEDGTANSFAQIAFDLGASDQPIARIAGINTGLSSSALSFVVEGGNVKKEAMRIDSSGNVGIGTSSITDKLTVHGGIKAIQSDSVNTSAISLDFGSDIARVRSTVNGTGTQRPLGFFIGGSEKLRIDSSGNVGIGTTSPAQKLDVNGNIRVQGNYPKIEFVDTDSNPDFTLIGGNGSFLFYDETNDTERMRIDSSGSLLVGTTDVVALNGGFSVTTGSVDYINVGHSSSVASGNYYAAFRHGTNTIGTITQNGTTGVSYNTSSDERLKENITDSADAGSKVDAIQIRQFDWKADGSHQDYGVIAQELINVAPEAVHQPVDEEDMMGVDYSKLVPMLIKEVQSLRSRVAELESE